MCAVATVLFFCTPCTADLITAADALQSAGDNFFLFSQHVTQDNIYSVDSAMQLSSLYRYDGTSGGFGPGRISTSLTSVRNDFYLLANALRASDLTTAADALESVSNNLFLFSQHVTQDNIYSVDSAMQLSSLYRYDGTSGGFGPGRISTSLTLLRNDFDLAANALRANNFSVASGSFQSASNNLFIFSQHVTQDNIYSVDSAMQLSSLYRYDGTSGGFGPGRISTSLTSLRNDLDLTANALTAVPEPSSVSLVFVAMAIAGIATRKRRTYQAAVHPQDCHLEPDHCISRCRP
jgi:hypothetical protein